HEEVEQSGECQDRSEQVEIRQTDEAHAIRHADGGARIGDRSPGVMFSGIRDGDGLSVPTGIPGRPLRVARRVRIAVGSRALVFGLRVAMLRMSEALRRLIQAVVRQVAGLRRSVAMAELRLSMVRRSLPEVLLGSLSKDLLRVLSSGLFGSLS